MRADLPKGTIELEKAPCGCERVETPTGQTICLHDESCTQPPFVPEPAVAPKRLRSRKK